MVWKSIICINNPKTIIKLSSKYSSLLITRDLSVPFPTLFYYVLSNISKHD